MPAIRTLGRGRIAAQGAVAVIEFYPGRSILVFGRRSFEGPPEPSGPR
jgi:hypothetical protein